MVAVRGARAPARRADHTADAPAGAPGAATRSTSRRRSRSIRASPGRWRSAPTPRCRPTSRSSRTTRPCSARPGTRWCGPVKIGAMAYIGAGATILPGAVIGDGAVVGAGSVVTGEIPAGTVAVGNPARVIGDVGEFVERHRRAMAEIPRFEKGPAEPGGLSASEIEAMKTGARGLRPTLRALNNRGRNRCRPLTTSRIRPATYEAARRGPAGVRGALQALAVRPSTADAGAGARRDGDRPRLRPRTSHALRIPHAAFARSRSTAARRCSPRPASAWNAARYRGRRPPPAHTAAPAPACRRPGRASSADRDLSPAAADGKSAGHDVRSIVAELEHGPDYVE